MITVQQVCQGLGVGDEPMARRRRKQKQMGFQGMLASSKVGDDIVVNRKVSVDGKSASVYVLERVDGEWTMQGWWAGSIEASIRLAQQLTQELQNKIRKESTRQMIGLTNSVWYDESTGTLLKGGKGVVRLEILGKALSIDEACKIVGCPVPASLKLLSNKEDKIMPLVKSTPEMVKPLMKQTEIRSASANRERVKAVKKPALELLGDKVTKLKKVRTPRPPKQTDSVVDEVLSWLK